MKRGIAALAVVAAVALAVTGCEDRPCLRSHEEVRTGLMPAGKALVPYTYTVTVCDEYGGPE